MHGSKDGSGGPHLAPKLSWPHAWGNHDNLSQTLMVLTVAKGLRAWVREGGKVGRGAGGGGGLER